MAAKIRMTRMGGRSKAFFRVVVIDESSARDARPIDILGHYDPKKEPAIFEVDKDKAAAWIKKGAIPSPTVRKYLGKIGVLQPVDYSKAKKRAPKNPEENQAEAAK